LDVSQYAPEELEVKCSDSEVMVTGKHEERQDNTGHFVSRQFSRRFVLPDNVDASRVASALTRDGTLTVEATKKAIEAPEARKIPIEVQPHGGDGDKK
jgi:crystallin alpha B